MGQTPASALSNLRSYVASLRKLLGNVSPEAANRIDGRRSLGYRLNIEETELDIARFDELVSQAHRLSETEGLRENRYRSSSPRYNSGEEPLAKTSPRNAKFIGD